MNRLFHDWAPWKGEIPGRRNGALISNDKGQSTAYALWNLEERGQMFIADGEDVYEGMIIGENSRGEDLDVNPLKGKKLTNVRASGKDESIRLTPPRRLTLEQAMAWIEDDELVEVTPAAIRLRKAYLDPNERKKRSARRKRVNGRDRPPSSDFDDVDVATASQAKPPHPQSRRAHAPVRSDLSPVTTLALPRTSSAQSFARNARRRFHVHAAAPFVAALRDLRAARRPAAGTCS